MNNYFNFTSVNKFQAGGTAPQGGNDTMNQIVQAVQQAVKEIQSGKPGQACQMVAQIPDEAVALISLAAPEVGKVISQIKLAIGGRSQVAKHGAKLSYIHELRTGCAEGEVPMYFKEGGHICKKCVLRAEMEKEKAEAMKCGGKAKVKKACGGTKTAKKYF